ncbi:VCBS repeat-containing protein [Chloroflexales bacterium ZM16-3]|nr:VCBS repeat-containing protein [Chloroflexales bacterium ZM16-3]
MRHPPMPSFRRSLLALLTAALICTGCASAAPPPTPTEQPTVAIAPTVPDQTLQPSIDAAVRATLVAQAVAATIAAPTPVSAPPPPPLVPVFAQPTPFLHPLSGISGLMPTGWSLEGDASGITIRPAPGEQGSLTAAITATGQLPVEGPAAATSALFTQLKQPGQGSPAPQVVEETYETNGGGRLTLSADSAGTTTYARATMTERGLLVVQLTVPTDRIHAEDQAIRAVFDSVKPSGDYLTSTACLSGFDAPEPMDTPFSTQEQGTLFATSLWYKSKDDLSFGGGGIGDFNGDGLDDLAVVTNDYSNAADQLYILLQRDSQILAPPICFSTEGRESALAVGDLNGDGRDDLVVGGEGAQITLFLSAAEGVFGTRRTLLAGDSPDSLAVGDLNGDGRMDVAVGHWQSPIVGLFIQQEDGEMAPMISLPATKQGYDDIAIGDVNGDGLADVVRLRREVSPPLEVFFQQPDHSFANGVGYDDRIGLGGVKIGDVTGDGKNDLVIAGGGNRPNAQIDILAQGAGGLLVKRASYPSYDSPRAVQIADLDGDGRNDVLLLHWGFFMVTLSRQRADGTLAEPEYYQIKSDSNNPQAMDVGDLNNDGRMDVIVAAPGGFSLLYGRAP